MTQKYIPAFLRNRDLKRCAHETLEEGCCAMEAVSVFLKDDYSDAPSGVDPFLRYFVIQTNDLFDDEERQKLKAYVPLIANSACYDLGLDQQRMEMTRAWLHERLTAEAPPTVQAAMLAVTLPVDADTALYWASELSPRMPAILDDVWRALYREDLEDLKVGPDLGDMGRYYAAIANVWVTGPYSSRTPRDQRVKQLLQLLEDLCLVGIAKKKRGKKS